MAQRPSRATQCRAARGRGKPGWVIGCALAHRAYKIAYALVRDQAGSGPLGLRHIWGSSMAASFAGAQQRSTWSARSAARTNEVDRGQHRHTIGQLGSPEKKGDLTFINPAAR